MFKEGFNKECKCSLRAYKLVIMDLQMPVMGGQDSSKEIFKLIGDEPLTTIVALTSYTMEKVKEECLMIGMKEVIHKPLNFKNLHRIMHRYFFEIDEFEYKLLYKEQFNESFEESIQQ